MIDVRELRLGNYMEVYSLNEPSIGYVAQLTSISNGFIAWAPWLHWNHESTRPIPLTEQWLLDFGWKYYNGKTSGDLTKDTYCKLDIDFIGGLLQVKSHYEKAYAYRVLEIKYVHQLQNLFSSLGEELVRQ